MILKVLLIIYVPSAIVMLVLFLGVGRGKFCVLEEELKPTISTPRLFIQYLFDPLREWIMGNTGPNVGIVFRSEKSLGKGIVGIFVGIIDSKYPFLAVPTGDGSFYGHPILAIEGSFNNECCAEVIYDGRYDSKKSSSLAPFRIDHFNLRDPNAIKEILDGAKWWIGEMDKIEPKALSSSPIAAP